LLAPRHLIFTTLEGALIDSRTDSFSGTEEALGELARRAIPYILLTTRTRAQIEPIRRKLEHKHPFVTENGGGIFFPDGYFNIRLPGAARVGRYLAIAQGRPYTEVCAVLDEVAEECGVGVAGFHHMSLREIADNTGLRPRDAELAREREFDEPFFFTSGDDKEIEHFVEISRNRGFQARRGPTFWHYSSGCDAARAVRTLAKIFRESGHTKLRLIGIGASEDDLAWLRAVDTPVLLQARRAPAAPVGKSQGASTSGWKVHTRDTSGPAAWNDAVLNMIS
jgi:mannosyl-3-phosphoglycerate phosphatase